MPANPEHLHSAFDRIGRSLQDAAAAVSSAQERTLRLLDQAAADPSGVLSAVREALASDPVLRCALPSVEPISATFEPRPVDGAPPILAADGSQVVPSRHDEVAFAVINIASVLIEPGTGRVPQVNAETTLLFGDDLYAAGARLLTEGDLALRRDLAERRALRSHSPDLPGTIVLSDGPLELWGAKDVSDPAAFEGALRQYLDDLREMLRRGFTLAGYVDKPGADLVVRMLELLPSRGRGQVPLSLRGVSDRWLFGRLLKPGQRSAIFALQSSSRARYTGDLALHVFYLNAGRPAQPALARIEIPDWVAQDPGRIANLHRALLSQCALLGDRPYPYVLHRAHEAARITPHEKDQIRLRLLLEMRNRGLEPEPISPKSSAKANAPAMRRS